MVEIRRTSRLRLGLLLWVAGLFGVAAMSLFVLPRLLPFLAEVLGPEKVQPVPVWLLSVASLAQSALILALAVWSGTALAPAVGLHAPAFEAVATGDPVLRALRPQLLPGLAGGAFGGLVLVLFALLAPPELAAVPKRLDAPLLVRVLYGGVTEEILLRWGFMTLLVWLAWRCIQRRIGEPRTSHVWLAIIGSAIVFGVAHLPIAAVLIGELTARVVAFVIVANSLFGIVAGYLFWRYGLESAIVAHSVAHVLNYVAGML